MRWHNGAWALAVALSGCGRPPVEQPARPFLPIALGERPGLHNIFRLTERLYSGSQPEGDAGFRSVRELGATVVVSVDGARPDLDSARRAGLRYVHLPIGYDGVPREVAVRIAAVVRDAPGPVYLHCHHGKHRGPAAAAAAVRCLDGNCGARAALDFLAAAGTDPKYRGLFASVEGSEAAPATELDAVRRGLPEAAPVPDMVRLMVEVDDRWDRIKLAKAAGWRSPPEHPDIDPPHEALLLREAYREVLRLPNVAAADPHRDRTVAAEQTARDLEIALRGERPEQNRRRVSGCRWRLHVLPRRPPRRAASEPLSHHLCGCLYSFAGASAVPARTTTNCAWYIPSTR